MAEEQGEAYAAAAAAISGASFLLIAAGAGFSADAGLPVYADIARCEAYRQRGLEYDDVCRARWQAEDPALFFGFWGHCLNAYRRADPHEGYAILRHWCERAATTRAAAAAAVAAATSAAEGAGACAAAGATAAAAAWPPSHYVYTSNVDGLFARAGFDAGALHELHGSVERWAELPWRGAGGAAAAMVQGEGAEQQGAAAAAVATECTESAASAEQGAPALALRRVPPGFVFSVDDETMLATPGAAAELAAALPARPPLLRADGAGLRPAVLMFGDGRDVHEALALGASGARYQAWEECVEAAVAGEGQPATAVAAPPMRLVVLEIGCGMRVPSVRIECEDVLRDAAARAAAAIERRGTGGGGGARVTMIRINPDHPACPADVQHGATISIRSNALPALQEIDRRLAALQPPAAKIQ